MKKLIGLSTRLLRWFNGWFDETALLPLLLLKIRSVIRMLDTKVCSGALVWLLSPAWDAVILTLDVGFICPFVVIDPTDEGATTVVAPGRIIDNFPPIPDAESLPVYRMAFKLCILSTVTAGLRRRRFGHPLRINMRNKSGR
jgi:hypothetical protein